MNSCPPITSSYALRILGEHDATLGGRLTVLLGLKSLFHIAQTFQVRHSLDTVEMRTWVEAEARELLTTPATSVLKSRLLEWIVNRAILEKDGDDSSFATQTLQEIVALSPQYLCDSDKKAALALICILFPLFDDQQQQAARIFVKLCGFVPLEVLNAEMAKVCLALGLPEVALQFAGAFFDTSHTSGGWPLERFIYGEYQMNL